MKAARFFNISYGLFVIIAYLCVLVSPSIFWPAAFLALTVPIIILFECLRLFFFIFKRSQNIIYPLVLLLLGYPFISASVSFFKKPENYEKEISMLSYNTRVFNLYNNSQNAQQLIEWVTNSEADIKCIQEFYNLDKTPDFATTKKISRSGKFYHFVQPLVVNRIGGEFGLAIFSKYPIVARGVIDLQSNSTNSAIFADINYNGDTIRVVNLHLQSLSLDENDLTLQERKATGMHSLIQKLKFGFLAREKQLKKITRYLETSKYPLLVCGDLNDTPYSYSYFKLKSYLNNTFEEKGNGFGFSYNGKLSFLRIDNQFYSNHFSPTYYRTHYDVDFTDHYPITAAYFLK